MRVVGGKYRSHPIICPTGKTIRPTTDRTRESLFNILENRIEIVGVRVLDLFAGTGALGIEALSRGASYCVFVEQAHSARAAIRRNIDALGIQDGTKIFNRDATQLGELKSMRPFQLAFADPPYGKGLGVKSASCLQRGNWLSPGAIFILEESTSTFPAKLEGFSLIDSRAYGNTTIGLFEYDTITPIF